MEQFARENGVRPKPIDDDAMQALVSRKWPGNVRELKNAVERSAILCGDRVTIADLPEDPHASPFEEESDARAAEVTPDARRDRRRIGGRHGARRRGADRRAALT